MIANPIRRLRRRLRSSRRQTERQTLKDKTLARRLRNTFERDLEETNLKGLHFYVQQGTVTLHGTVRHELDRVLLVSLVRQVPGVKGVVTDDLQVVSQRFQETESALQST